LAPTQGDQDPTLSWAVLLRVSPGPWHEASRAVVKLGFDAMPPTAGSFLCGKWELPVGSSPAAARTMVTEMIEAGTKGLFFLPSRVSEEETQVDEALLEACAHQGFPVVLIDRNLRGTQRGLERDLIASDHFDGGARCAKHLLDQGRHRVACVLASPTSSHNDRLAGYLFALQTDPRRPEPIVVWVPSQLEPRELYSWMAKEILERGVDGVLCYQDYTAVGLIMELLRRGVNIPGKIGVVGCDDLPIGHSFSLGVTTYAYPSREICQAALKVMRNRIAFPGDPPTKTLIAGRMVIRESSRLP
jgi:LacI family transcriptional regulator